MAGTESGHDPAADLPLLRDAAVEAGRIALSYMERGEVRAWDKAPGHPVTEADLAVNAYLEKTLRGARPDYGWLSEETADRCERLDLERVFVVDPIDGTRAFMRGDPHWCVGLAVVSRCEPVTAVVYEPALGEIYEAVRGGGATLNGEPIRASACDAEEGCRLIVSPELLRHPGWPEPWPDVRCVKPKPNATLYRLAQVAAGASDGTLALWRKSDWDLAAGALLVEEAGGRASTHLGEPFRFNRRVPAQRSLVAAGKALHPLLVERVRVAPLPDPHAADARRRTAMSDTPTTNAQLLHIVFGGELKDVTGIEFEDLSKVEFVGAFPNYAAAYDAWKSAAQRTVDNAEMRYFILHAHRLLDPETGTHHHA